MSQTEILWRTRNIDEVKDASYQIWQCLVFKYSTKNWRLSCVCFFGDWSETILMNYCDKQWKGKKYKMWTRYKILYSLLTTRTTFRDKIYFYINQSNHVESLQFSRLLKYIIFFYDIQCFLFDHICKVRNISKHKFN